MKAQDSSQGGGIERPRGWLAPRMRKHRRAERLGCNGARWPTRSSGAATTGFVRGHRAPATAPLLSPLSSPSSSSLAGHRRPKTLYSGPAACGTTRAWHRHRHRAGRPCCTQTNPGPPKAKAPNTRRKVLLATSYYELRATRLRAQYYQ
jgi:hypothetical protein